MTTPGGRALARLVLALALPVLAAAGSAAAPRVHVIATGGTISNDPGGRLAPAQLVAMLPARERLGEIGTELFANVSSTTLALDDWLRLAKRIGGLFEADAALDGIVVTTGTDTLEELAWFLHLTVSDARPVVLVGAMHRPADRRADGPRNLADAIRVAGAPDARGRGTLVVMHGQVHAAVRSRKRHATAVDAFDQPPDRVEGLVSSGRVRFTRPAPAERALSFALDDATALPRVDILLTYQGAPGDLIEAAVRGGARGLVVAGAGAGALTRAQREAAHRALREGVPVVVSTRTAGGLVTPHDPLDERLIPAGSLDPYKARILLMLALAKGTPTATELGALFERASAADASGSRR